MRSADLAVATARERSYSVETILALDNATPATSDYFHQPRFDHWERWELDERDLGRARNAIVPQTKGRYIAFLDADDLFSENWLAEGIAALDAAAERGERAIAIRSSTSSSTGTRRFARTSLLFIVVQPAPSLRAQLLRLPVHVPARGASNGAVRASRHPERPVVPGLAIRDRDPVAGMAHLVVQDTIIFKRRRDFSLVVESNARKSIVRSLPEMAIDRVRDLAPHGPGNRRRTDTCLVGPPEASQRRATEGHWRPADPRDPRAAAGATKKAANAAARATERQSAAKLRRLRTERDAARTSVAKLRTLCRRRRQSVAVSRTRLPTDRR